MSVPEVELHSRAMLKSMIAAAKADGQLGESERSLVEAEMQRIATNGDTRH